MAKLEAGEFAVSKQGETMHVIGKVARLWRLIGQKVCLI